MFSEFSLDKWALRLGYFAGDIVGLPAGLIKKMIESGYAWKEKNKILCTWGGLKKTAIHVSTAPQSFLRTCKINLNEKL